MGRAPTSTTTPVTLSGLTVARLAPRDSFLGRSPVKGFGSDTHPCALRAPSRPLPLWSAQPRSAYSHVWEREMGAGTFASPFSAPSGAGGRAEGEFAVNERERTHSGGESPCP